MSQQRPSNIIFLVSASIVLCGTSFRTSGGNVYPKDVVVDDRSTSNVENVKKKGQLDQKTVSDDIFNPVLQNFTALQDWLDRKHTISSSTDRYNGVGSVVARDKRSSSLWSVDNQCSQCAHGPNSYIITGGELSQSEGRFFAINVFRRCCYKISSIDASSVVARNKRSSSLWCADNQCSLSLCPWIEQLDYERSRTPMIIKRAECLTVDCNYNFPGLSQHSKNILNVYTTCDVVRDDIRVWKNGAVHYLLDWPIACMCTQRRMSGASNNQPNLVDFQPNNPNRVMSATEHHADRVNVDEANNQSVQNDSHRRPVPRYHSTGHVSRRQRHLRHLFRQQQRRRQNLENYEEYMRRRQEEQNMS